jgi:hypothetical protein
MDSYNRYSINSQITALNFRYQRKAQEVLYNFFFSLKTKQMFKAKLFLYLERKEMLSSRLLHIVKMNRIRFDKL